MARELHSKLNRLTAELRDLNKRLQNDSPEASDSLNDFREALDAVRLTAWTVHELSRARRAGEEDAGAVLILTANERARRFRQMTASLCADLDAGFLKHEFAREALTQRLEALQQRLQRVDTPAEHQEAAVGHNAGAA